MGFLKKVLKFAKSTTLKGSRGLIEEIGGTKARKALDNAAIGFATGGIGNSLIAKKSTGGWKMPNEIYDKIGSLPFSNSRTESENSSNNNTKLDGKNLLKTGITIYSLTKILS